ncbi:hypothetical protein GOB87_12510 [Acetobacter estunensis]|uniref:Uncharacterized protein n=1 Tax=Acetobacter estunensis TaxID=104097 RepID=A0A967B6J0_9PROT|nr:hypothetical protein [Acetobacter estunensis]NHO54755.1 hypothetical protein [Acetobacter estunensis]
MTALRSVFRLAPSPLQGERPASDWSKPGTYTCACCGLAAPGTGSQWSADRADLIVCPVCALLHETSRASLDLEATAIWWPASWAPLTQSRLLHLVGQAHRRLWHALAGEAQGAAAAWSQALASLTEPSLATSLPAATHDPLVFLRFLRQRREEATRRLGTASLRHITTAMLLCDPGDRAAQDNLSELRSHLLLLPEGRLFSHGHDVYPQYLAHAHGLPSSN